MLTTNLGINQVGGHLSESMQFKLLVKQIRRLWKIRFCHRGDVQWSLKAEIPYSSQKAFSGAMHELIIEW